MPTPTVSSANSKILATPISYSLRPPTVNSYYAVDTSKLSNTTSFSTYTSLRLSKEPKEPKPTITTLAHMGNSLSSTHHRSPPGSLVSQEEEQHVVEMFGPRTNASQYTNLFYTSADVSGSRSVRHVRLKALVDDGGGCVAIDRTVWETWQTVLGPLLPSSLAARCADGILLRSSGCLPLTINVAGIACRMSVEIFDSKGCFEILLGRPWLGTTRAIHDYGTDLLQFKVSPSKQIIIHNGFNLAQTRMKPENSTEAVSHHLPETDKVSVATVISSQTKATDSSPQTFTATAQATDESHDQDSEFLGRGIDDELYLDERRQTYELLQRLRQSTTPYDSFHPERVTAILKAVQIGSGNPPERVSRIQSLIASFADVFALGLSEVKPVKFIEHKIEVNPNIALPLCKIQPPVMTPSQRKWTHAFVDKLLESGVIAPISFSDVKCVNKIVLAPKVVDGPVRSVDELCILANAACVKAGLLPPHPDLPSDAALVPITSDFTSDSWRFCHNFRPLNKATIIPSFPNSDIGAKQNRLGGKEWYLGLDLASAYHACPVRVQDWGYLAFQIPDRGYYAYTRMPFGLSGAGATCQEMIFEVFGDIIGTDIETQMDDICSGNDDWEVLFNILSNILQRCCNKGLSLAPSKVQLFVQEIVWSGMTLSKRGVNVGSHKVSSILTWPTPSTARQLLGFLSTASFFRSCILGFAEIAEPLYALIRTIQVPRSSKKGTYKHALQTTPITHMWRLDHEQAFARLKASLTTAPALRPHIPGQLFVIGTDASRVGVAAFLAQWHPALDQLDTTGSPKMVLFPIHFASRLVPKAMQNAHSFILELAAVKFALEQFHKFIWGERITIITDCLAVANLLRNDRLPPQHSYWKEFIQRYHIEDMVHKPGRGNPMDALSRWGVLGQLKSDGYLELSWEKLTGLVNDMFVFANAVGEPTSAQRQDILKPLLESFEGDPFRQNICRWLLTMTLPDDLTADMAERVKATASEYFVDEGLLWRLRRRDDCRVQAISKAAGRSYLHDSHRDHGHWGRDILVLEAGKKYDWPGMSSDAVEVIKSCQRCQQFGPALVNFLLQPMFRIRPFDLVAMDYVHLPPGKGGYSKALIAVDYMSRWMWGFMVKGNATSKTSATAIRAICEEYCPPKAILSDNATHFKGPDVLQVCDQFNVRFQSSSPYVSHTNGLAEAGIRLLVRTLRKLCIPEGTDNANKVSTNWPELFSTAITLINSRVTPIVGTSPRAIMFGQVESIAGSSLLSEVSPDAALRFAFLDGERELAMEALTSYQSKLKQRFDAHSHPAVFQLGDLVLLYNSTLKNSHEAKYKLAPPWFGPFVISTKENNTYGLKTLSGRISAGKYHALRLKKFFPGSDDPVLTSADFTPDLDDIDDSAAEFNYPPYDTSPDEDFTLVNGCYVPSDVYPIDDPVMDSFATNAPTNVPGSSNDTWDEVVAPIAQRRTRRAAASNHKFIHPRY